MTELLVYSVMLIAGMTMAVAYGQKTRGFRLSEYVLLFVAPLAYVLYLAPADPSILAVFIASALIGPVLEWFVGSAYHQTIGERLWTYRRLGISGYTSLLSIPLWGIVGVFFYFLARIFAA